MNIKLPPNNKENLKILQDSMTRFFEFRVADKNTIRNTYEPDISVALGHHYYGLIWDTELEKRFLSNAVRVGWRYLILDGEDAIADIYLDFTDSPQTPDFSHIGYGPMAKRTLDALIYAEKRKAVGGSESEFRHLEIPALYFAAVWLHAKDGDLIIPILKGFQPIEKFETISGENFFQYLLKNFSDVVNRA